MPRTCKSNAKAKAFIHLVSEGLSLRQTAAELGCSKEFLRAWLNSDATLSAQYAHAKSDLADEYAESVIEISDSATVRDAHVARLKVDSRKWVAAKLLPKKYGDRPNEINVNTQVNLAVVSVEDQQRLQARRLELLGDVSSKVQPPPG